MVAVPSPMSGANGCAGPITRKNHSRNGGENQNRVGICAESIKLFAFDDAKERTNAGRQSGEGCTHLLDDGSDGRGDL